MDSSSFPLLLLIETLSRRIYFIHPLPHHVRNLCYVFIEKRGLNGLLNEFSRSTFMFLWTFDKHSLGKELQPFNLPWIKLSTFVSIIPRRFKSILADVHCDIIRNCFVKWAIISVNKQHTSYASLSMVITQCCQLYHFLVDKEIELAEIEYGKLEFFQWGGNLTFQKILPLQCLTIIWPKFLTLSVCRGNGWCY